MLKNVSPGRATTCSYSQAVVEHVMDSINSVWLPQSRTKKKRYREREREKKEKAVREGERSEERLLIRKSGNSNGFSFYAFLSLFCGFITQSARARVAN